MWYDEGKPAVQRMMMVDKRNRAGYEFSQKEMQKVLKRVKDVYKQFMQENDLKVDISKELAKYFPAMGIMVEDSQLLNKPEVQRLIEQQKSVEKCY